MPIIIIIAGIYYYSLFLSPLSLSLSLPPMQRNPPRCNSSTGMGNCVSAPAEDREAKLRSAMIDKELRSAARDYGNTIKILLLGEPTTRLP